MSKSSATTQGFNLAELSAIPLASARLEQYYKGSLLGIVLLPVYLLFFPYINFWLASSSQLFNPPSTQTLILIAATGCCLLATFAYLFDFYLSPLNRGLEDQYLRKNEAGWWLGAGSHWRSVDLVGEALITYWLILLRVRFDGSTGSRYVWLWQDAVGASAHRRLRLLLRQ
ncbi:hypothetical protein R50072_18290 [Simiduia litorea]|uniref:protein YgfX n=1 Tax=Simiduia litorea TaxID=1435348 RepID=UPI0036F3D442